MASGKPLARSALASSSDDPLGGPNMSEEEIESAKQRRVEDYPWNKAVLGMPKCIPALFHSRNSSAL